VPVAHPQSDIEFTNIMMKSGTTPIIVDFFATWCGPCSYIAPVFTELSNKYINLKFMKVDVDKCKEAKEKNMVTAMPTFMVFLNGQRMDMIKGADKSALENLAHKWSKNCPTQLDSIPGHFDLFPLINRGQCECKNEDDEHTLNNLFDGNGPLISDCDEQLLIYIPFLQPVKIHSLQIKGHQGNSPKTVKIFANIPTPLDFDRAQSSNPIQTVDFTQEEQQLINLKYVKFQNVNCLQLFLVDNDGSTEKTTVTSLRIFGTPVALTTNMQEFKRVAGKAGEADH